MTTSYATGQDFLARYDYRIFGDLVSDDGTQEPADQLPQNENLTTALADAYGEIISSIVVGNRYTRDQLDPANLDPSGLSFLIRLNCDLAAIMLKRRRGRFDAESDAALLKDCNERLKRLQSGENFLLGVDDDHAKASTVSVGQPELIPVNQRQTIRFRTNNHYPRYPYTGNRRRISGTD